MLNLLFGLLLFITGGYEFYHGNYTQGMLCFMYAEIVSISAKLSEK